MHSDFAERPWGNLIRRRRSGWCQEMMWIGGRRSWGGFWAEAKKSGVGTGKTGGGRGAAPNERAEANGRRSTKREQRHVG